MLQLRLDHYETDLRQVLLHVTDGNNEEHRRCRQGSYDTHEIEVRFRQDHVVCMLRERDLFLVGIRNANGVYYFNDARPPGVVGETTLMPIGCSYTKSPSMEILKDETKRNTRHSFNSVWAAVTSLQRFTGQVDETCKVHLGILCFVISESMRFKVIFEIIKGVLTPPYTTPPFTFGECAVFVNNWGKLSGPEASADEKQYVWTSKGP